MLIAVLKGAVPFLADLVRKLRIVPLVDFLAISAYAPDSGRVRIVKDIDLDVFDRDVVLVEDIVDTGLTLSYMREVLLTREPASLRICCLLDKREARKTDVPLDYVGFEIPSRFVVGYGLDYAEIYRNLPFIGVLRPERYQSSG